MPQTLKNLRDLLEEAHDLVFEAITTHIYDEDNGDEIPDDCPYHAFIKKVDEALKEPSEVIDVTLKDQANGKGELKAKVDVGAGQIGIWLDKHGDCNLAQPNSRPVMIELYNGDARTLVWADINQEDPTDIISMSGALEANRRED